MGLCSFLTILAGSLILSTSASGEEPKKIPIIEWETTFITATPNPNQSLEEESLEAKCVFDPLYLKTNLEWKQECIEHSLQKGRYCLLVNKAKHELRVYKEGKAIKSYPIELGPDPYADKQMEGDGRTPEGRYNVKMVNHHSVFHRALLIDYPNSQDREEFRALKKSGKVPPHLGVGGWIEIHGNGTMVTEGVSRFDWTAGCVALSNSEIDDLYLTISPDKNRSKVRIYILRYEDKESCK